MDRFATRWLWVFIVTTLAGYARAGEPPDPALLTIERIFESRDFVGDSVSARWYKDGAGYLTLESSQAASGGRDIVLHDALSGELRVLVSAARLVPPGASAPLAIDDYFFFYD